MRAPPPEQRRFEWPEPPAPPASPTLTELLGAKLVRLGLAEWVVAFVREARTKPAPSLPPEPLIEWAKRRTPVAPARPRLPLARVTRGGPDPHKPCDGCPERATCRTPCQLLTRLIPREEIRAWNEVSSPALMGGGGHDEQFLTIPDEWADEPENPFAGTSTDDRWRTLLKTHGGARLTTIITTPGLLTAPQREVLGMFLAGKSRKEIGETRGVSRQAIHKVVWAAVRALRPLLARPGPVRAVDGRAKGKEHDV